MREKPGREYADADLLDVAMAQFMKEAKDGHTVWLTEDGEPVAAVVPREVAEAGLRALGREG